MSTTTPKTHDLKLWPDFFDDVAEGRKTFELRENDRGFLPGDKLLLREWDPETGYSGREILVSVPYIAYGEGPAGRFGLKRGHVCMSIVLEEPVENRIAAWIEHEAKWVESEGDRDPKWIAAMRSWAAGIREGEWQTVDLTDTPPHLSSDAT